MRSWIYLTLAAGAVPAAALLILGRNPLWLPVAALLLVLPTLLYGWWQTREALRRHFSITPRYRWLEEPEGAGPAEDPVDAELRGLGYRPAGTLLREGEGELLSVVYIHETLPIYALAERPEAADGTPGPVRVVQLDSFFEGGGRLVTSAHPHAALTAVPGEDAAPRLTQLRIGGSATALDGQHAGTVQAWAAGRRQALPAAREALIGYLEADHQLQRRALERRGWLPFPTYLRILAGAPGGVLKF
jgi:hypothetical protein